MEGFRKYFWANPIFGQMLTFSGAPKTTSFGHMSMPEAYNFINFHVFKRQEEGRFMNTLNNELVSCLCKLQVQIEPHDRWALFIQLRHQVDPWKKTH